MIPESNELKALLDFAARLARKPETLLKGTSKDRLALNERLTTLL